MKKRTCLILGMVTAFAAPLVGLVPPKYTPAAVTVRKGDWVPNRPPGLCVWAATETLAVSQGWECCRGLTDGHPYRGNPVGAVAVLKGLGVPCLYARWPGPTPQARDVLRFTLALPNGGACVTIQDGDESHFLLLSGGGKNWVQVVDCNDRPGKPRRLSLTDFYAQWEGDLLVIGVPK